MKQFFLKVFTWWNGQTFGTQLWTWRFGELVGQDEQGNLYYRTIGGKIDPTLGFERRWVIYNGVAEASRIVGAIRLDGVREGRAGERDGAQRKAREQGKENAQRTTTNHKNLLQEFPGSLPSRPRNICPPADTGKPARGRRGSAPQRRLTRRSARG